MKKLTNTPPFGYCQSPEDDRWLIEEREANTIRYIYKLFLEGAPRIDIVQQLNQQNTLTRNGKKWSNITLGKFLTHERVDMYFSSGNSEIVYEPILTEDLYKRIKQELERLKLGIKNSPPTFYLLSKLGLLYCGYCGSPVKSSTTTRNKKVVFSYYLCTARQMKGKRQCSSSKLHKHEHIDSLVIESAQNNVPVSDVQIQDRFELLHKRYVSLIPSSAETAGGISLIPKLDTSDITSLLTDLEGLTASLKNEKRLGMIKDFSSLDINEKRELLKSFIERIDLFNDKLVIKYKQSVGTTQSQIQEIKL
jgi:hypothetical protein